MRFFTLGTGDFVVDDDKFTKGTDDNFNVATQDDDGVSGGGGGGHRQLDQVGNAGDKSEFIMEGSALDIAVFHLVRVKLATRILLNGNELRGLFFTFMVV